MILKTLKTESAAPDGGSAPVALSPTPPATGATSPALGPLPPSSEAVTPAAAPNAIPAVGVLPSKLGEIMSMRSPFAIRPEDALSWHHATRLVAGIAQRAGYRVRAMPGQGWQVWATDADYGDLVIQAAGHWP